MSVLTKSQTRQFTKRINDHRAIVAEVRFDDQCNNGHNTFSITGEIRDTKTGYRRDRYIESCGCIHDDIAQHFPELAGLIKWHLTGTDGPLHYISNVCHFASDRDCWGKLKGEPYHYEIGFRFSNVPFSHSLPTKFAQWLKSEYESGRRIFDVIGIAHDKDAKTYSTHYTFAGFAATQWHECPFHSERTAQELAQALAECPVYFDSTPTAWGEGKEREFDKARSAAIWPEATDEQLSLPPDELKALLLARLPLLMAEFRGAVESLGMVY